MRTIHCPKDIGFVNTFDGEDCEREQFYNDCYHCWTSAIAVAFQKKRAENEKKGSVKVLKNEESAR